MEFRRWFSGSKPESESSPEPAEEGIVKTEEDDFEEQLNKQGRSRRKFVKGMAVVGGAVAGAAIGGKINSAVAAGEKLEQHGRDLERAKEILNGVDGAIENIDKLRAASAVENGRNVFYMSLEQEDKAHEDFRDKYTVEGVARLLEDIHGVREVMGDEPCRERIEKVFDHLNYFDALGSYYKFIKDKSYKDKKYIKLNTAWRVGRPKVRADEFLPKGDEVPDLDIDPRLHWAVSSAVVDKARRDIKISIEKNPAWAGEGRQKQFRELLNDDEFRKAVSKTDSTLAEVYSIIKAAIKNSPENSGVEDHRAEAFELIKDREELLEKEIIGQSTDTYIHFSHERREGEDFDDLLGDQLGSLTRNDTKETKIEFNHYNPDAAGEKILNALATSKGETVVFFQTHGSETGITANNDKDPAKVTRVGVEKIAQALVKRILADDDPNALEKMKIILTTCHGYDFSKNLAKEIKKEYREMTSMSAPEIGLPTIITSTQEASVSFQGGLVNYLDKNVRNMREKGKLDGAMLLRRIQPSAYHDGDVTYMTKARGKWRDVAEAGERVSSQSAA